jgi:type I restriction enzyme S subunit
MKLKGGFRMANNKVLLSELCDTIKGKIGIQKATPGKYPMVVTAEERLSHNDFHFDSKAVIVPLVSSTGHGHASIKRIHYQEGKFALGSILAAITVKDEEVLDPYFLYIYLSYFKDQLLVPLMKGSANVSLNIKKIGTVEIVLPSIIRQREIIELEKNDQNVKKFELEIKSQKSLLSQLKQSILQEAIQGKLTAKWRAEREAAGIETEPASELLKRIKAEKARLIKEKKIKKEKPLPPISEEEKPFELPEGWEWCRLAEFADIKRGISPKYSENGVSKMINQKCVRWFDLEVFHCKSIDKDWFESLDENRKIKFQDLLVNSTGDGTIGRSAIVNQAALAFAFDSHVLRVRPYFDISSFYLAMCVNSTYGQGLIQDLKGAKSTKQTELGVGNLSSFSIPVPPQVEQKAIVEKVELLMAKCAKLETEINQSEQYAQQLMQAVLKEAFEE